MEREQLTSELIDFHEGRGQFEERKEYVGMLASSIPELFADYFAVLSPTDKTEMASILVMGLLDPCERLGPYVGPNVLLVHNLCLRNYTPYFVGTRVDLEREFTDPVNIEQWVNAPDRSVLEQPDPGNSVVFKRDWHYPLILWGILYLLKSEQIDTTYYYLREHAQSGEFRQALADAKNLYTWWMSNPP